jgi:hypothetical protein
VICNKSRFERLICRTVTISFRAINDRAEEIKNVTKGKEDDKVYRGLNYYNQYIEKKESLIGTGYCPLLYRKQGVPHRYGVPVLPSLLVWTLWIAVPYIKYRR